MGRLSNLGYIKKLKAVKNESFYPLVIYVQISLLDKAKAKCLRKYQFTVNVDDIEELLRLFLFSELELKPLF